MQCWLKSEIRDIFQSCKNAERKWSLRSYNSYKFVQKELLISRPEIFHFILFPWYCWHRAQRLFIDIFKRVRNVGQFFDNLEDAKKQSPGDDGCFWRLTVYIVFFQWLFSHPWPSCLQLFCLDPSPYVPRIPSSQLKSLHSRFKTKAFAPTSVSTNSKFGLHASFTYCALFFAGDVYSPNWVGSSNSSPNHLRPILNEVGTLW